ncbi:MAG: hypothetical protein U1A27_01525 [Phycisphaerae bacterium]
MPYDEPDATDPMELHGVEVATDDPGAVREMACSFVAEYARLGVSAEPMFELFASGQFAGPALAYRQLGAAVIAELIAAEFRRRGPRGARLAVEALPDGVIRLPVVE